MEQYEYESASNWFGNFMITAIWLKSELNEKENKIKLSNLKEIFEKSLPLTFK